VTKTEGYNLNTI